MKIQNFKNHIRFYYPHHFIFYPVLLLLLSLSTYYSFQNKERSFEYQMIIACFIFICWLSFMMRQHYAIGNQNRIIRLELRLRYYQLTQQRLELLEDRLTLAQLAALRFASDDELVELISLCVQKNLTPNEIKRSIKNWVPDYMRV